MKGKFITFEGSEGSGKSTQIALIRSYLHKKKKKVIFLREPGGVPISEKIRNILLDVRNVKMCPECETLLYMAARAQLVAETIEPYLKKGFIILCDRFLDSTLAYQGYGSGVDTDAIQKIGQFAIRDVKPHLTLVFDIDAQEGLNRIKGRKKDRIERRAVSYHNRVRRGYLTIARQEPRRVKIVAVNKPKEEIHRIVCKYIDAIL